IYGKAHTPLSHGPVSVSVLLKPTGRVSTLREGEPDKPDLATYVVMCLLLFLLVLLIVFFINCQLRNSFFASMPYDRSLREALTCVIDLSVYNDCFPLLHGLLCPSTVYHKSCALCKRLFSCMMLNHD
uniref:Uncharacterized protein n=1 Tax=Sinocyclocheilus grahami TaxID=75366 RepID=A0A672S3L6_SINGR